MKVEAKVIPINQPLEKAWADYLECMLRANSTMRMEDGIEAGRAWRRWLELFLSDDLRKLRASR